MNYLRLPPPIPREGEPKPTVDITLEREDVSPSPQTAKGIRNVDAEDKNIRERGDAPQAQPARDSAPSHCQKADSICKGGLKAESSRKREGAPPRRSTRISSAGKCYFLFNFFLFSTCAAPSHNTQ